MTQRCPGPLGLGSDKRGADLLQGPHSAEACKRTCGGESDDDKDARGELPEPVLQ